MPNSLFQGCFDIHNNFDKIINSLYAHDSLSSTSSGISNTRACTLFCNPFFRGVRGSGGGIFFVRSFRGTAGCGGDVRDGSDAARTGCRDDRGVANGVECRRDFNPADGVGDSVECGESRICTGAPDCISSSAAAAAAAAAAAVGDRGSVREGGLQSSAALPFFSLICTGGGRLFATGEGAPIFRACASSTTAGAAASLGGGTDKGGVGDCGVYLRGGSGGGGGVMVADELLSPCDAGSGGGDEVDSIKARLLFRPMISSSEMYVD